MLSAKVFRERREFFLLFHYNQVARNFVFLFLRGWTHNVKLSIWSRVSFVCCVVSDFVTLMHPWRIKTTFVGDEARESINNAHRRLPHCPCHSKESFLGQLSNHNWANVYVAESWANISSVHSNINCATPKVHYALQTVGIE